MVNKDFCHVGNNVDKDKRQRTVTGR